jgi:hypothetical protein
VSIELVPLGRRIATEFGPFEIKTLRVPLDRANAAVETDLLERPSPD